VKIVFVVIFVIASRFGVAIYFYFHRHTALDAVSPQFIANFRGYRNKFGMTVVVSGDCGSSPQ
jgi:hypothetical protein